MDQKYNLNYIKCPDCLNVLGLSFISTNCPNPICSFDFKGLAGNLDKTTDQLIQDLLTARKEGNDREVKLLATAARFGIAKHLIHFITCKWGTCYNSLFKFLIIPYLDDINSLKIVLSSNMIIPSKGNAVISKNGYKIFWDLYEHLMRVRSQTIRGFLRVEFPDLYKQYYKNIQEKFRSKKVLTSNS